MNKSIPLRTYVASAFLCLTLFASCSADDDTALPEGKYPMTFATAMEGLTQTRATTDNTWKGDEKIAMQVGSEVKQYIPTSGTEATLTGADADNTFYWQNAGETKLVSAWYCGDGSTAAGQPNANQLPMTWTVQTDQSGDGYQQSDFIYAMPQNIAYSDRDSKRLTFKHLPAKVVINLTKGNGLTEENIRSATVRIVSQVVTSGEIDKSTGIMAPITTTGSEEISPNLLAAPKSGFQKSVQAIVVPQKLAAGTKFIKVTIGAGTAAARDYYYTTKSAEEANFECGKQYTYDITVTKGEELVVTEKTAVTWQEGTANSGNVELATTFNVTCPEGFKILGATHQSGDKYTVNANQTITISYAETSSLYCRLKQGIAKVTSTTAGGTITLTVSDIRGDLVFSTYAPTP